MHGIRSINTLKLLCKRGDISHVTRGNRVMIAVSEIERVRDSEPVRTIRAIDKALDQIEALSSDEPMTEEEMEVLHQSRPGVLPWERKDRGSDDVSEMAQ